MLRMLNERYHEWGLTICIDKSEYMATGGQTKDVELGKGIVTVIDLGLAFTKDGSSAKQIRKRIGQTTHVKRQLNAVL